MKFTVMVRNSILGKSHCEGTFDRVEDAVGHAVASANKSRAFCTFEIWRGTPRNPIEPLKGHEYKGVH
jgi:hypothetical protein